MSGFCRILSDVVQTSTEPVYKMALLATKMSERPPHISISVLWEYSRNPNPTTFVAEYWDHLRSCEDCVSVLWLSNTSTSLEDLIVKLKERGIEGFE